MLSRRQNDGEKKFGGELWAGVWNAFWNAVIVIAQILKLSHHDGSNHGDLPDASAHELQDTRGANGSAGWVASYMRLAAGSSFWTLSDDLSRSVILISAGYCLDRPNHFIGPHHLEVSHARDKERIAG